jgi:hypothetical protein
VMYCAVPEVGGATTFTKADVFVKPKPLMATFFTYYGTGDGLMDSGYTEHSGCPVVEGEKWITAAWMRLGVDKAHSWDKYDPSGVEIARYDADGSPLPAEGWGGEEGEGQYEGDEL